MMKFIRAFIFLVLLIAPAAYAQVFDVPYKDCLLYTSDAADE